MALSYVYNMAYCIGSYNKLPRLYVYMAYVLIINYVPVSGSYNKLAECLRFCSLNVQFTTTTNKTTKTVTNGITLYTTC